MRRRLSSRRTFLLKWLGVTTYGLFAVGSYGMLFSILFGDKQESVPAALWIWIMFITWAVMASYTFSRRLTYVWLVNKTLVLNRGNKYIVVRPDNIGRAWSGLWGKDIRSVHVEFRRPTEFGDKIVFIPTYLWKGSCYDPHPIIDELNALIPEDAEPFEPRPFILDLPRPYL